MTVIPWADIRFPTKEEEEAANRFVVHRNYVVGLADFILSRYGDAYLDGLLTTQKSLVGYARIQGGAQISEAAVQRFLPISWSSELQLELGANGSANTLRYTNAWAPVHAYYAAYMSMQAWFAANGMGQLVDDHTSSLRAIAGHVHDRKLFPPPFGASCTGCPELKETRFFGFPADFDPVERVEVLSRPTVDTFWPRYATALSTTRKNRLERNQDEWKHQRGRKRMSSEDKRAVAANLSPTTFFDYLWRLRVRSNYRDVTSILTWNVDDVSHQAFAAALRTATSAACLLLESLFVRKGGKKHYEALSGAFLAEHSGILGPQLEFLTKRRELLLS